MGSGAEMLREAAKVIEDRHKTYGPPTKNFENIARLWNAFALGCANAKNVDYVIPEFSAADVAIMMALVKIARLAETPDHVDSWTDIAGYAACGREVASRPQGEGTAKPEPLPDIDHSPVFWWHTATFPAEGWTPTVINMPAVSEDEGNDDLTMGR